MEIGIRAVAAKDMPQWLSLSREYDRYVEALQPGLVKWYEGGEDSPSFESYMNAKIRQGEAYMAVDGEEKCLGIIAFSTRNNRISFFAVSHAERFDDVGARLLEKALKLLRADSPIRITVVKTYLGHLEKQRDIIKRYCFKYERDDLENGIPVEVFVM